MSLSIEPATLKGMLDDVPSVLVVDLRDPNVYANTHILSSVSFTVPKMMLRRVKTQPNPKLEDIVVRNKSDFDKRETGAAIVAYNQNGVYDDDVTAVFMRCLETEGRQAFTLRGKAISPIKSKCISCLFAVNSNSKHVCI
jgi:rhodanese-related sulfurtransferase